jgi:hypothetical protein
MPDRYHIHTVVTPGRFHRIGKFGGIDWREDCSRCSNCVKPRCNFDVYKHESEHNRDPLAPTETLYECKACFSCVQGCTKGLLSLAVNPEYLDMGDDYWKPDILFTTWSQSDTGKIPVSGAGYRGPFHGFGFDSIWTDMSEIVRPTRDGIHGREYISTSVDVGVKPMRLSFSADGKMIAQTMNLIELPMPVILDIPAWPVQTIRLAEVRSLAAKELNSIAVVTAQDALQLSTELLPFIAPLLHHEDIHEGNPLLKSAAKMVELVDCSEILKMADSVRNADPQKILSVRMTLTPGSADRIVELSRQGLKVFHLCADLHGCERTANGDAGRHVKDVLREIHGRLVPEGVRDAVTLILSGGIALAEHMAKSIICGADLIGADTALMVALGCRVCRDAHVLNIDLDSNRNSNYSCCDCPAEIDSADSAYAVRRTVNLMGAWHNQLIEVLGAMGIREVRRLRGEMGRAIFMEEIEKEAFGDLMQVSEKFAIA